MPLPQISLTGGVVRDPELRFSAAGKAVASFTLACKDRVRGQNGEWTDGEATFINVVCFGKPAENLVESVEKGTLVTVTGKLEQQNWTTPEGDKRSKLQVVADTVSLALTFKSYGENNSPAEATYEDSEPPF
jgi:single-strand DNA-binding protein